MSFTEKINEEMKAAMKSGDKLRLEVVRSVRAGILEFEKSGSGKEMTDEAGQNIILAGIKKRKDSIEQFDAAGRKEMADKERAELQILLEFLPKQLSDEEVELEIKKIITETGASGSGDFKKVIGPAMKNLRGRADSALIQQKVKELLG